MVVADSPGISRVPGYSGASSTVHSMFPTGLSPSMAPLSSGVRILNGFVTAAHSCRRETKVPTTPTTQPRQGITRGWFRLFPVRSPLLGESLLLSFPRATKMFQFTRLPSHTYLFSMRSPGVTLVGFPHSDTHGSSLVDSSPWLIAVFRVLLRLLAPRYPPYALCSLTYIGSQRSTGCLPS